MMWPFRKRRDAPSVVAPSEAPTRPPVWQEILFVTAKSRGLSPSPEWFSRVSLLCMEAPDQESAIDIAEREFDHLDTGTLDTAIAAARRELRRLRQRRRRMAEREAA